MLKVTSQVDSNAKVIVDNLTEQEIKSVLVSSLKGMYMKGSASNEDLELLASRALALFHIATIKE